MTNYLVTAHFGETIRTTIPVDAFEADGFDEHAERRWLEQNYDRLIKDYPNAERFTVYRQVAS